MKITKEMIVGEVLKIDNDVVQIFMDNGMHCLGCPSSQVESIMDACVVHSMDCDKLLNEINEHLEKAGK